MKCVFFCCRITDTIGPTETSIAPRQRPKANSTTATPSVLTIQSSATPVKVPVPGEFSSHRPKGNSSPDNLVTFTVSLNLMA